MAMMMFHDGQPFHTSDSLYGLANQVDFLRRAGAISIQVTVHTPAVGTREFENTLDTGKVLAALGERPVTNAENDGNHAIVAGKTPLWQKQFEMLLGYFRFYNPLNLVRAMRDDGSPLRKYRVGYQIMGFLGTLQRSSSSSPTCSICFSPSPGFTAELRPRPRRQFATLGRPSPASRTACRNRRVRRRKNAAPRDCDLRLSLLRLKSRLRPRVLCPPCVAL